MLARRSGTVGFDPRRKPETNCRRRHEPLTNDLGNLDEARRPNGDSAALPAGRLPGSVRKKFRGSKGTNRATFQAWMMMDSSKHASTNDRAFLRSFAHTAPPTPPSSCGDLDGAAPAAGIICTYAYSTALGFPTRGCAACSSPNGDPRIRVWLFWQQVIDGGPT